MKRSKRVVELVAGEGQGGCRLWAYGAHGIAHAAGCSWRTVIRAIKAGEVDPADLGSVVEWVAGRLGAGSSSV